ncbi:MAG: hypothetical protein KBC42_03825 [Candidatus Pacebacteria bacterium]|nr:hypothetical protein [Candidatus Paceibacterota bacterium]MBP9781021.1 hypothetical protein [Candidatus Paceibacterota bacterium]
MENVTRGLQIVFFISLFALYVCTTFNLYPNEIVIEEYLSKLNFFARLIIASVLTMILFLLYFFAGNKMIKEVD